ncbi:MAG: heavy-metal-associated domain-containing protein [Methylococcaceae bacterium]|nr:heavy-metal-associated domain-containing protein [Methylococcaceae bacterium]
MKTTIAVKGMKCGGCEATVREAVGACAGVTAVVPSFKANSVEVEYDEAQASLEEIKQVIAGKGFQVG